MESSQKMSFDGGAIDYWATRLFSFVLILITFGLAYPWSVCMMERWKARHTMLGGRRFKFVGSGIGLFGHYIKWWLFSVLTLGIYIFWLVPAVIEWVTENTELDT